MCWQMLLPCLSQLIDLCKVCQQQKEWEKTCFEFWLVVVLHLMTYCCFPVPVCGDVPVCVSLFYLFLFRSLSHSFMWLRLNWTYLRRTQGLADWNRASLWNMPGMLTGQGDSCCWRVVVTEKVLQWCSWFVISVNCVYSFNSLPIIIYFWKASSFWLWTLVFSSGFLSDFIVSLCLYLW